MTTSGPSFQSTRAVPHPARAGQGPGGSTSWPGVGLICISAEKPHPLSVRSLQNGPYGRSGGRIEDILQSHHFRSGEELEATLHRYVALYNQQLPQSALRSKTPLEAIKDWHKLKPELFKKQPYHHTGCDM